MRIESKARAPLFVLAWLSLLAACSSTIRFERVEHFPSGIQIDTFASAWINRVHPSQVSEHFDARYADVWRAAKVIAGRLEKRVEKAATTIDEETGKIQITDDQEVMQDVTSETGDHATLRRSGATRLAGWKDEYQIRVVAISERRTTVTVSRAVLALPRFRFCFYVAAMCKRGTYEAEVSNGQIENWVLTQITDELARTR